MFNRITFLVVSFLLLSFSVNAGILYIEAPEEYSKEQLENPTDNATTEISDFIINEVNKVDEEVADRVVILTKTANQYICNNTTCTITNTILLLLKTIII